MGLRRAHRHHQGERDQLRGERATTGTTYFFVVTAFDNNGNESSYSNEVSKSVYYKKHNQGRESERAVLVSRDRLEGGNYMPQRTQILYLMQLLKGISPLGVLALFILINGMVHLKLLGVWRNTAVVGLRYAIILGFFLLNLAFLASLLVLMFRQ